MSEELDKSEITDRDDALRRLNAGSNEMIQKIHESIFRQIDASRMDIQSGKNTSTNNGHEPATFIKIDPETLRRKHTGKENRPSNSHEPATFIKIDGALLREKFINGGGTKLFGLKMPQMIARMQGKLPEQSEKNDN